MRIPLWAQARVLLIVACYSFLILPILPVWAQQQEPPSSEPQSYTITEGDTLWDIATRELGDPLLWPRLWLNNPSVANPDIIFPGNDILLRPKPIPFVAPEAPPPVEEVTPEAPISEAPPPVEEVTPEAPPVVEEPPVVVEEPLFETPPPTEKPKPWYKKWWVWTMGGVVIGGIIAALALQGEDGKEKGPTGSVTVTGPEP